jgi:uroporphyrin-III C-methyltransferase/precorrin-2 dehydrogenase/sirohydrochlorin ferrochelatase
MRHLPVFLDLQSRRALVLGTGEAAERKADMLRRAGAELVLWTAAPSRSAPVPPKPICSLCPKPHRRAASR